MANDFRLTLMAFPQRWDGAGTLAVNVLLIPTGDPFAPLIPKTPAFVDGTPAFSVVVVEGLGGLPSATPAPGVTRVTLAPTVHHNANDAPAAQPRDTFELLRANVENPPELPGGTRPPGATIKTSNSPARVAAAIRKALPQSYLDAGGGRPNGDTTTTEDEYGCAIREAPPSVTPPSRDVSWGELISYALRQPRLASLLGLRYELSVSVPGAALAQGGWVYVTLADDDPWLRAAVGPNAKAIRVHAARVPALDANARPLFAAVQFPLDADGTVPRDDALLAAERYADGFAKLVHADQPVTAEAAVGDGGIAPGSDLGVQIGWDDEQVVQWQNDQLALMSARRSNTLDKAPQLPLGVLGYRVDVADVTPAVPPKPGPAVFDWDSLVAVRQVMPKLGTFTGELEVEPAAVRPGADDRLAAWLPRHFALWRGGSLCVPDPVPNAIASRKALGDPRLPPPAPPPGGPSRVAVNLDTLLSYGRTYAFRVRLCDLSSGGPRLTAEPIDPGAAAIATQLFARCVPPKAPAIVRLDAAGNAIDPNTKDERVLLRPASLVVRRPLIGYPEVLYTSLGDSAAARDQIGLELARQAADGERLAGLPDPDVTTVEITVAVRAPLHDVGPPADFNGPFRVLYRTTRTLDAVDGALPLARDRGTRIALAYVDAPSILPWAAAQPDAGPLFIPRGRDVRITLRSGLRAQPGYYAPEGEAAHEASIEVRIEPHGESPLLIDADGGPAVRGMLFRRPPGVDAPPLVAQLANELGVVANGDSLASPPGRRVVFGASRALHHRITADGELLTFGSSSELLRSWIVAIVLDLDRDWTWDGLDDSGFAVERTRLDEAGAVVSGPEVIGSLVVPRVLGAASTAQPARSARARTRLVFLDAVDPHEPSSADGFARSLRHQWKIVPSVTSSALPNAADAPDLDGVVTPPAPNQERANVFLNLRLPIATPPAQVPKIVSVGLALSPYTIGPGYASTEPRRRALWVEFAEPVHNVDGDALFARVIAHGADPLLYAAFPDTPAPREVPLPLDPELVRVVFDGDTDDRAGEHAMTRLVHAQESRRHFLLPLPPGVDPNDPELFGFYTYEFRVGHSGPAGELEWWSTANARFGSPLRVVGVQHPAPPLAVHASRAEAVRNAVKPGAPRPGAVIVTAPYANPVLDGVPLFALNDLPRTTLWFFLYAQVVQTDGSYVRNVLLATSPATFTGKRGLEEIERKLHLKATSVAMGQPSRDRIGVAVFQQSAIDKLLAQLHLSIDAPLSVLAAELLPGGTIAEPENPHQFLVASRLGEAADRPAFASGFGGVAIAQDAQFPFGRILRASPLTPIRPFC